MMGDATNAPWDVYREIHKAMRFALFGVTTLAGSTDGADDASVRRLLDEWRDVRFVLHGHHGHEDEFCDPLIAVHAAHLRDDLIVAHDATDARLAALDALAAGLLERPADERATALQRLHLELAAFTAFYCDHLRVEEEAVMPLLNAGMSNAELEALTDQIRGSVPPDDMCVFLRYMVPSMHFAERVDLLGGMYAGAPPEIFEQFRAAAEACLPPTEYLAVARTAGFA